MNRLAYSAMAVCLAVLMLLMASCTPADGGLEIYPDDQTSAPAATSPDETDSRVDTIPDFTVLDMDGNEVKLSDFFGTPIVLNFWASWCPPCRAELPDFEEACKKYEGKVVFLMVNLTDGQRETMEEAKDFVASQGYSFPVYFDTKYEAAYTYGVSSIPQTYFIHADGSLETRATGMISASQLEQGIGMIYSD